MDEKIVLHELSECVTRYNTASRAACELWAEAEREAHRVGQLAAVLLGGGTSAAEVGRLLVAVDDACKAPAGLMSRQLLESERLREEEPFASPRETGGEEDVRVPSQGERAGHQQPAEQEPCDRTRAFDIVRDVRWPSGITVGTVTRALAADGRVITEEQVRGWLKEWVDSGDVASIGPGRYLHSSRNPRSLTLATGEHAPLLLRRAFQMVSGAPLKEMSTRELATALDEDVNVIGGELCAMLREVGITRPNRGKISARYEGATGPRLPGYKAETLGQAISVYNEREPRDPQTTVGPTEVGRERALELVAEAGISGIGQAQLVQQLVREGSLATEVQVRDWLQNWSTSGVLRRLRDGSYMQAGQPSAQAGADVSSVPDLLARAYEVVRAQDQEVISSRSLFAVLQQQRPTFRDSSDMAGQLVRIMTQVGVTRPDKGYVHPQPSQPRVLGFTAATLRRAIKAHQRKLVLS
ncbi:hypothetical protein [Streptomyces sp. NPDC092903]|uniref:hypothetical protein n=1 Tax=Streptomyces sp. NPDC092903 TaxID=3366017 RepID=UPI0037F12DEF